MLPGPDFKNWVQTFYCSITCCVAINGYASHFFNLEGVVRQGCPLSGTLFFLGIESPAQGIGVGAREKKKSHSMRIIQQFF